MMVSNARVELWRPILGRKTNLDRFRGVVNATFSLSLSSYYELYEWSVEHYDLFWDTVSSFTGIIFSVSRSSVVDMAAPMESIPKWFVGARLNYAENMLHWNDDRTAVIQVEENGHQVLRSFSELYDIVAKLAAALRKLRIQPGDVIAGYIPNTLEALAAMLATAAIGAVWTSTSPDFGVVGVLDRFSQVKPKVIFSINSVTYNGRIHPHMSKLSEVVSKLDSVVCTVIVHQEISEPCDLGGISNAILWDDMLTSGLDKDANGCYSSTTTLSYEQLPFGHPLFILYSSGTTGVPKCIVHSAGGTLIQHNKEHILLGDMNRDDIMLYYTSTLWMMWAWMCSSLGAGSAVVLYNGSPFLPSRGRLFDLVDELGITILGVSAKYIDSLQSFGVLPMETHSLKSLRTILSTGSPLKPGSFDYVYKHIKTDVILGSISGGTDIVSCFAGSNPTVPVVRGEIQCRNLGMKVESWNEDGHPVKDEAGELVCTAPFPCMPTHFWNDDDGSRYKSAYFKKFPGVWAHGDFVEISSTTGGVVMLGRSDGILNPNGVRFGSAELYNVVEKFEEVIDSVAVAQRSKDNADERVILFVKCAEHVIFNDAFEKKIKLTIRQELSPRHVPAVVLPIADIPHTLSGKKVEVSIRRIISGEDVQYRSALANPGSLDLFYDLPALRGF